MPSRKKSPNTSAVLTSPKLVAASPETSDHSDSDSLKNGFEFVL